MTPPSPPAIGLALLFLAALVPPVIAAETVLVESDPPAAASALVPTIANGGSTLTLEDWTMLADPPNAAEWLAGTTGVGYEASPTSTTAYTRLINLNVRPEMEDKNSTAYIRVPFQISQETLASTRGLVLDVKYDDGFIAYLNGVEVTSANPPDGPPDFESAAGAGNADDNALQFERFDITPFISALTPGDNMLAIHGLNDGADSSDFLIVPRLIASDTVPPPPPVWPDLQFGRAVITTAVNPVDITHAGDGSGRLFIVERRGRIQIWERRGLRTFLDIRNRVNTSDNGGDERGLLGLAFPPNYAEKKVFYVNYISNEAGRNGATVLSRFAVNPDDPDDAIEDREEILLVVNQPEGNHNGGQIHFGKDGYLYFGLGDGGGGGDNHGSVGNGQEITAFLGKMLRLDVEGPTAPRLNYGIPPDNPFVTDRQVPDEIWAFGLRNPWRWSFDRKTGDMYIADVGQGAREEVNFVPATSKGGENYQWRRLEGFSTHNSGTPLTKGISTDPIHDYPRSQGTSITGGYVYRGNEYPRMQGIYFYGDYGSGRIWGLQRDASGDWINREFFDTSLRISSFGEDEEGNIYMASLFDGDIYRLTDTRDQNYLRIIDGSFDADGNAQVTFGTEIGKRYQLQFSTDLISWENVGTVRNATQVNLNISAALDPPVPDRAFFRVVELAD